MARFTKFGIEGMLYPAIYCFGDMRGLEAAKVDFEKHRLAALGVAIDKDIKRRITTDARRATIRLADFYTKIPIPEELRALLSVARKKEAARLCKDITVTKQGLVSLIFNAGKMRLRHRVKVKEFNPHELRMSSGEISYLSESPPGRLGSRGVKVARKLFQTFQARKIHVCHLFERRDNWHCFFFSLEELHNHRNSHWNEGAHLHYVSSLWCRLKPHQLLKMFDERDVRIPGKLHIRFDGC
jgi:hypothetical protein